MLRVLLLAAFTSMLLCAHSVAGAATSSASAVRAPRAGSYATRGVIQGFGAGRKFVNIAHEKIEGYMPAMTMPFEPRSPAQLDGLKIGDHVRFTFTATDDGRRLIDSIRKE